MMSKINDILTTAMITMRHIVMMTPTITMNIMMTTTKLMMTVMTYMIC